mmetsp:Transcript_22330/g.49520  ORF Transcript_22330/g.49520 Transcript_22330/m.49520 type:complete len:507 (-) Transcript_22330:425-1945(-)
MNGKKKKRLHLVAAPAETLADKSRQKKLHRVAMVLGLVIFYSALFNVSLPFYLQEEAPTVAAVPAEDPVEQEAQDALIPVQAPIEHEVAVPEQQVPAQPQQRQNVRDANPNWKLFQEDDERACRVIVENSYDFHYEVIESIVRRFPLPWDSLNCTITRPVIYDFSLFDNRFPDRIPFYIGKVPKYLNQTEFWGWKKYFEQNLQSKVVHRAEKSTTTSPSFGGGAVELPQINSSATGKAKYALYNNLILYEDYRKDGPVDAFIDVTCGGTRSYDRLKKVENWYCLQHGYGQDLEENDYVRSKSCWVSPLYRKDHCFFLPLDLPKFQSGSLDKKVDSDNNNNNKGIHICAPGGGRNQTEIIEMFSKIPNQEYNATLTIFTRVVQPPANTFLQKQRKNGLLNKSVEFVSETDYESYARWISQCDVYLPMTDPSTRKDHFFRSEVNGGGMKKLTGAIPLIITYQLPSVMHAALKEIYRPYLTTAPVETYSEETVDSRAAALTKMVQALVR